jgi:hypothetical protein
MFQMEAPNPQRTWEFVGYTHYSEWPKVADAVIEAIRWNLEIFKATMRCAPRPLPIPLTGRHYRAQRTLAPPG